MTSATTQIISQTFPPGSVIFRQGERGGPAYLVKTGSVALELQTTCGAHRLAVLGPFAMFGEISAYDGGPRTATAIAIEKTELGVIPSGIVRQKILDSDPFVRAMVSVLVNNLRQADAMIVGDTMDIEQLVNTIFNLGQSLHRRALNDIPSVDKIDELAKDLDGLDNAIKIVADVVEHGHPH